jgi:hypothetical protein
MSKEFTVGDTWPVVINGNDKRLRWVAADALEILPADAADPTPPDVHRILIEMHNDHDAAALRTFYCVDAAD